MQTSRQKLRRMRDLRRRGSAPEQTAAAGLPVPGPSRNPIGEEGEKEA